MNSAMQYQVEKRDDITDKVIAGYEVIRFGVPMIGQYVNTGKGRRVTISPVVPGARYRITAWALSANRRSATPAKYPTTREASECEILAHTFTWKVLYRVRWLYNDNWRSSTCQTSTSWTMSLSDNLDILIKI